MTDRLAEGEWEEGWEGHELAQMRRMARLSMAEKLRWLEQAHGMVLHLQQQNIGRAQGPKGTRTD